MPWIVRFKALVLAVTAMIVLSMQGCDWRPSTMGYQHRIFVLADSLVWKGVKDSVLATFEEEIYTPRTEIAFDVRWIPLDMLNEFRTRMNIFLIGVEEDAGTTNEYIRQALPQDFRQGAAEGKYFYVFNDDLYAKDQIGLIMFARNKTAFKRQFSDAKDEIYRQFRKKYYERLKRGMFERGEQEEVAEVLAENYGWKIRVQHDYTIANQNIDEQYVWLRRFDPDRWVSIWEMEGDSTLLVKDSLFAIRNRVLGQYYQGDRIVADETNLIGTDFRGETTKKLVGTWRNDSLLIGGPFRTYVVHKPERSKLYFIDLAVMAPEKDKKPYLDQLEVIASTFEVMNKNKKN